MAKYCIRCGMKNDNNATTCMGCGIILGGKSVGFSGITGGKDFCTSERTGKSRENVMPEQQVEYDDSNYVENWQENALIKRHVIEEKDSHGDFMYIVSNDSEILTTEYKVLNSMADKCVLRCVRIRFNGKDGLYYMTKELKALDVLIDTLESDQFVYILENILKGVNAIQQNGFLAVTSLDIRLKRIYVDVSNSKIYFTYIPLNERCYTDSMFLENEIRSTFANVIRRKRNLQSMESMNIAKLLEEPACSYGSLLSLIRQNRTMSEVVGR